MIPKVYWDKPLIHVWEYQDPNGETLGLVARYQLAQSDKKDIVPFFKRRGEAFVSGINADPRPLFGLDRLAKHPKDKAVFVVEGEKCAAALQSLGLCAVTSLGGSQAAKLADWTPLSGCQTVYLLPDQDKPGERYAADVAAILAGLDHPPEVKIVGLSGLEPGGDIVDWLKGFVDGWDGYRPINEGLCKQLKAKLWAEVKNAVNAPSGGDTEAGGSAGNWNAPREIKTKTPPVQAMTGELIPEPFRPWLADVGHRMQTPLDFPVISMIVIVSSVIGAGCGIRPKQQDDWEVIPNLWGACIGRPSVCLKSPSMKEALGLLDRLQAVYGEMFEREKKTADFDDMVNGAVLKDLKSQLDKAAKGKGKDRVLDPEEIEKLKAEYMELSEKGGQEPTRRLFKTNETTIQSMTLLQSQNPRGGLVFRDELTGLLTKWDREDGADERAYFLEGWNGNGGYVDVKIARGVTEAKQICISLLGGIQPDKLQAYLHQAQRGGNDGLMQRLQLAVWPDEPKTWHLVDTKPDREARQAAFLILQKLAELDFIEYGAAKGEHDDRPYFRFDENGQAIFNAWLTDLQTAKIPTEETPLMVEHYGKYRSLMPSLALIFHCIDIAANTIKGPVSEKTARLAVEWCQYLETHARRVYAMAESPEQDGAVRLAGKIKAGGLDSPFTARDIERKGWHGLTDRKTIDAAIEILIEEYWLMPSLPDAPTLGRRPLPHYHINPAVFEGK